MKKFSFMLLALAFTGFVACTGKSSADKDKKDGENKENTTNKPADNGTGATTNMAADGKEHVCTDKCKDGQHIYAHGEKGHTCGEECMKKEGAAAEHKCTDKCKDGNHAYAHGEKGHTCTEACMKKAAA